MSYCTPQILALASGIHDAVNLPSSLSIGYISGWLTSSGTLGDINTRLSTCFYLSGDAPCIAGGFGGAESNIASLVFQHDYWRKQAAAALQGVSAGGWAAAATNIKEGDSSISRESPTKLAAEYRLFSKEVQGDLYVAVANWKIGHSMPVEVSYAQTASYPTP